MLSFIPIITYLAVAALFMQIQALVVSNSTDLSSGDAASNNLGLTPWPDLPYSVPVGSQYGSLTYVRYGNFFFSEHLSSILDSFMALIVVRLRPGSYWPYIQKQVTAQFPSDDNSQPLSFDLAQGISFPSVADDYLATLVEVVRTQNAAHGVRQLSANVEGYAGYSGGTYMQQHGPAPLRRAPLFPSTPLFIAVEHLIEQAIFLEVMQIGPSTYPLAYKQRELQFLESTLAQLKTLPLHAPFIGRRGEGRGVFYDLQRNRTETRASFQFSYATAVSVTEAFLSFAQTVSALSYMHFKVVQIIDERTPIFIGYGTFARAGSPVLGGQNDSSAAVDIA